MLCSLRSVWTNRLLLIPQPRKGGKSSESQFCVAWKLAGRVLFLGGGGREGGRGVCGGGCVVYEVGKQSTWKENEKQWQEAGLHREERGLLWF